MVEKIRKKFVILQIIDVWLVLMFCNVTFIYNAFICTTDHCKVQTAFVSLFYIFIIILFTITLEGHAHSGI